MNTFDWEYYINYYPDLRPAGVDTKEKAWIHYIIHGKKEGRLCAKKEERVYIKDINPYIREERVYVKKEPMREKVKIEQPLIIVASKVINLSETLYMPEISNDLFYSCNTSIICKKEENVGTYVLNVRYVNYRKEEYAPLKCYTLNKCIILDTSFNKISEKIFKYSTLELESKNNIGFEDIKLFNYNNIVYFIGNHVKERTCSIVTGKYNISEYYVLDSLNGNILQSLHTAAIEKNWCYFENDGNLQLVYSWYPIKICKIINNKLILDKIITCNDFISLRGSTNGCKYKDETWFITHINKDGGNYLHRFVIFNKNTLRYSNYFKFENFKVEFCLGLIISETDFIISYSLHDQQSKIMIIPIINILSIPFVNFPISIII